MESQCAAQELALTRLQNQEAALKDSLAKMAALSEGLAKDKVELNRVLLQVSSCAPALNHESKAEDITEVKYFSLPDRRREDRAW